ncbi:GNAT family N-acetyltransferase [Limosilactobacillus caecicola]|uniref:GNAT family N-acetyltransferase n=1 Tax=Limosilactobacillus caecicola TaxID=2941332 RepID=UPI00203C7D06|nr:GNAT family N-acetyltransferase [Limosilactobacillus caecicola]
MSYRIRPATSTDLPAIVEIFNQAIPLMVNDDTAPLEVTDRQTWFQQFDDTHPIWVIQTAEQIVGWCALERFYPHPAYYRSAEIAIYIDNHFQRQHLGKQLLSFVNKQVQHHLAIKTVIAYVYNENLASQRLFTSAGYQQWGRLPQISEINGQLRTLLIFGKNF